MNLMEKFKKNIVENHQFKSKSTVIVAVSTGVDSMVLLDLLQHISPKQKPRIVVAHVNHQLRDESEREAAFLERYCHERGISFHLAVWPKKAHPQTGIEAAARTFRYHFFSQIISEENADALMTAHHADDQAETVLMKLIRGGSLNQLIGIKPSQPFEKVVLIRPLLSFSKNEIKDYAVDHQLTWFEDSTNQSNDVLRNRIRHEIVPQLKNENNQFLAHVASFSKQLTNQKFVIDQWAQSLLHLKATDDQMDLTSFMELEEASQRVFLRWYLERTVESINDEVIEECMKLLHNKRKPQATLNLANKYRFIKSYNGFSLKIVTKSTEKPRLDKKIMLVLTHWVNLDDSHKLGIFPIDSNPQVEVLAEMRLSLSKSDMPLAVRTVELGDSLVIKGGGHQLIRRIQIDQKVPDSERHNDLVVTTSQREVLWLINRKKAWRNKDHPGLLNYKLIITRIGGRNG